MPWTYLTVYTHIPPPTHTPLGHPPTHTHTQNNKCETNLQIKSVSFVSESGNSCVSSGGRSEGVLRILEPKTIAKEIKLIELIGMPYICCVHMFSISQTSKKHYNIYLYHTYVTTKSHWSTAVGCNYIEYTAPGMHSCCARAWAATGIVVYWFVCPFVCLSQVNLLTWMP